MTAVLRPSRSSEHTPIRGPSTREVSLSKPDLCLITGLLDHRSRGRFFHKERAAKRFNIVRQYFGNYTAYTSCIYIHLGCIDAKAFNRIFYVIRSLVKMTDGEVVRARPGVGVGAGRVLSNTNVNRISALPRSGAEAPVAPPAPPPPPPPPPPRKPEDRPHLRMPSGGNNNVPERRLNRLVLKPPPGFITWCQTPEEYRLQSARSTPVMFYNKRVIIPEEDWRNPETYRLHGGKGNPLWLMPLTEYDSKPEEFRLRPHLCTSAHGSCPSTDDVRDRFFSLFPREYWLEIAEGHVMRHPFDG